MATKVGRGRLIAMPIFELNKFNDREKHHLQSCDFVFTCSDWAGQIVHSELEHMSWGQIFTVPLGVDTSVFYNRQVGHNKKCTFFNCGKWELRKGHDIIITAFNQAFPGDEDVDLWMMCDNPFFTPEETEEWERYYKDNPKVQIIHRAPTQNDLANIMSLTTCGVFPSRAEGWNLELLEMMACCKPVIATNYSGHTQFCNSENCYLIEIDNLETAYDGKWFHGEGEWAEIGERQIDQMVKHMQTIYNYWKNEPKRLFNNAGLETAKQFSWSNTADAIIKHLDIIGYRKSG
jgi:glycosyltransferase involved in cell wall biosynthesis